MRREIVKDLKKLRIPSVIATENVDEIIRDLEDTLAAERGYGLTAVQIGIPLRIGIVRTKDLKLDLINPVILEKGEKFRHTKEGCLSIPGIRIDTTRYWDITIRNQERDIYLYGLEAVVCQHEINHMDGKLILDKEIKWRKRC